MSKHYKQVLKSRGWSYRKAAEKLGVTYQHICLVMNGRRKSRRLLAAVAALPQNVGRRASN